MKRRNPARIGPVLDVVRQAWEKNPQLRLAQLILNLGPASWLYTIEDGLLVERLISMYEMEAYRGS